MVDVNECGVLMQKVFQVRFDAFGGVKSHAAFINNQERKENHKFWLELNGSIGRVGENARSEEQRK